MAFNKDPQAKLTYGVNWTAWLANEDPPQTISTSTFAASPDGLTLSNPTFDPAGKTTVWIAGGAVGTAYTVTNHIVTAPNGLENDRSLKIVVREM